MQASSTRFYSRTEVEAAVDAAIALATAGTRDTFLPPALVVSATAVLVALDDPALHTVTLDDVLASLAVEDRTAWEVEYAR